MRFKNIKLTGMTDKKNVGTSNNITKLAERFKTDGLLLLSLFRGISPPTMRDETNLDSQHAGSC